MWAVCVDEVSEPEVEFALSFLSSVGFSVKVSWPEAGPAEGNVVSDEDMSGEYVQ